MSEQFPVSGQAINELIYAMGMGHKIPRPWWEFDHVTGQPDCGYWGAVGAGYIREMSDGLREVGWEYE